MIPYENVIVTDLDGCVLYYEHAFHMWMVSKGYKDAVLGTYYMDEKYGISKDEAEHLVRAFNESSMLKWLPPIKDAIKYIRKLHEEHGFVFHAITAVPNTPAVVEARRANLENLFGKTAFERVIHCEHSAEKPKFLRQYEETECYWVEDLGVNAIMGLEFGLKPLLMDRHYNRDFSHDQLQRVSSWKQIYEIVTGEGLLN